MKTRIFIVTWTSYTESDNYLYQTDRVFTDEQEAKAFYEGEMNAALDDVRGEWDEEEGEYPWTEQEDFSDFNADGNSIYKVSREVGTEDGYQIEVKFETKEIDVPEPKAEADPEPTKPEPKKTYSIWIDAQTANARDSVGIFWKEYDENPLQGKCYFGCWLHEHFPLIQWTIDDGEDSEDTDYVQYVCYENGDKSKGYLYAKFEVYTDK